MKQLPLKQTLLMINLKNFNKPTKYKLEFPQQPKMTKTDELCEAGITW